MLRKSLAAFDVAQGEVPALRTFLVGEPLEQTEAVSLREMIGIEPVDSRLGSLIADWVHVPRHFRPTSGAIAVLGHRVGLLGD